MNIKELIDDIAKEHHIILEKDDPIFISVTLNEKVMQVYVSLVENALMQHYDNLSILSSKSLEATKESAAQLITQTAIYVSENLKKSISDINHSFLISLKKEVEKLHLYKSKAEESRKRSFYFACISVSSAIMSTMFFLSKLF
jgi:hypothetical protein